MKFCGSKSLYWSATEMRALTSEPGTISIGLIIVSIPISFLIFSLDSWFVPAFSAVAESEALLKQVIPFDQGFSQVHKYAGIFRFRFWFGRWIGKPNRLF